MIVFKILAIICLAIPILALIYIMYNLAVEIENDFKRIENIRNSRNEKL